MSTYNIGDTVNFRKEKTTVAIVISVEENIQDLWCGFCGKKQCLKPFYVIKFTGSKSGLLQGETQERCERSMDAVQMLKKAASPSKIWKELNEA